MMLKDSDTTQRIVLHGEANSPDKCKTRQLGGSSWGGKVADSASNYEL